MVVDVDDVVFFFWVVWLFFFVSWLFLCGGG